MAVIAGVDLCKYKKLFGEPKTGIHSVRFLDIAILDIIVTIIGAWIISKFTKWDFWPVLIGFFLFGILVHKLLCVDTTINKLLFGPSKN